MDSNEQIKSSPPGDGIPTSSGLTHGDEYKLLRDEVIERIKAIHQTELFGGIGVGIVYSWFILNKDKVHIPALWFVGPCVVLLCGISCSVNVIEMKRIGRYLAKIESAAFKDEALLGWEREQRRPRQRIEVFAHLLLSISLWLLALGITTWASWKLSR